MGILSKVSLFKQYVAVSFATAHFEINGDTQFLAGAGPTYGLNLYGFTAQLGAVIGTYTTYHPYDGVNTSGSPIQIVAQIGYAYFW